MEKAEIRSSGRKRRCEVMYRLPRCHPGAASNRDLAGVIGRITGETGAELLFSATQDAVRQVAISECRYPAADMSNRVRALMVPDAARAELERRARAKGRRPAWWNGRIMLLADGLTGAQIGARAGCTSRP